MLSISTRAAVLVIMVVSSILTSPTILNNQKTPLAYDRQPQATQKEKESVATKVVIKAKKDERAKRLKSYLSSKGSPLAPYAQNYVKIADKYDLDWRFLPAIAGVESTFGIYLMPGSYNPYGWGGGKFYFKNWVAGTEYVANQLRNSWGIGGKITPWKVGPTYAASPNWAAKVTRYMTDISTN